MRRRPLKGDCLSVPYPSLGGYCRGMVMSDRPEVKTASWQIAAVDVATLVSNFVGALGRLPFRTPWRGPSHPPRNMAVSATREFVRSLIGYASSLPIDEFRSLER